jgi:hypothetical protein
VLPARGAGGNAEAPHKPTVERCGSRRGAVARANFGTDEQHCSAEQCSPVRRIPVAPGRRARPLLAVPSVPLRLVYSAVSGVYNIELAQHNAMLTNIIVAMSGVRFEPKWIPRDARAQRIYRGLPTFNSC